MSDMKKDVLMRGLSDSQVNDSKQSPYGQCSSEHSMIYGLKFCVLH